MTKTKKDNEEVILNEIVEETTKEENEGKISEQELAQIQSTIKTLEQLTNEVGGIEVRKHALLKAMETVQQRMESFRKDMVKKYGTDNINIQTGEIAPMPENSNPQENGEANKKD